MIQKQISLKPFNAFRTEAYAKLFCEPQNITDLKQCILNHTHEEKLIVGGGCNLLFTQDFDGLVIKPNLKGIREISDDEEGEDMYLEVMASEDWDDFVDFCVKKGYSGLENLSFIPGTVGASPVQNIGAYGSEVKDCIREVVAFDLDSGEAISFSNSECEFGYRDSIFKRTNQYVIISVVFQLKKTFSYRPLYFDLNKELEEIANPTIQDVRDAVIRIRQRKLPDHRILPNCGSFFKNPYITEQQSKILLQQNADIPIYRQKDGLIKTSAAFLIDRAGYKGKRIGNVGTYSNQALIVVNYGASDGSEIVGFMKDIQIAVNKMFNILLEPEVKIL